MKKSRPLVSLLALCVGAFLGGCEMPAPGGGGQAGSGGRSDSGGTVSAGGSAGSGGTVQSGGSVGSGGSVQSGGSHGSGGTTATSGSGGGGSGGGTNSGGVTGSGGGSGGSPGTGGATGSGGRTTTDGGAGTGGRTGTGGATRPDGGPDGGFGTGGRPGTGGAPGTGGRVGTGGAIGTGGQTGSGGATTCDNPTWNPPDTANGNTGLVAGLQRVWEHSGSVITAANNIKIYQVMANKGSLNYCARWVSDTPISATERKQVEALISKCDHQWFDKLTGWGCWPYDNVQVKVVLWAVKNKSVLTDWSDAEGKYVENSAADCPSDCGPWAPNKSFSGCSTVKYDEFFWLDGTKTDYTGWGSATGFYMALDPFMRAARSNASTETIVAHEMGHSHGLDDFYDWQPDGWKSWVMNAGSSSVVTETDGWMLRDVWRHVRSKYGYPGP